MTNSSTWRTVVCLLIAGFVAGGCGLKTVPIVPDSPRPKAPSEVTAVTRDAAIFLSWPVPRKNVEGRSMEPSDIVSFRINRAEGSGTGSAKKGRYRLYAEIDARDPAPAIIRDNVVTWPDAHGAYDRVYYYQISAISKQGGVSAWSEEVKVVPLMSLAIPLGLKAQAGDSSIRLSWEPVTTRMGGGPAEGFVGYNIYRGNEAGRFEGTPLNKEPLVAAAYVDASAVNDRTYTYLVRAADGPLPGGHESPDSVSVTATPRDMTPPARPTGLTAVPGVDRVFLTWNENKEADVAGYQVYRAQRASREFERLTAKPLARTTFADESVVGGNSYRYAVTSVDAAGNESARSDEKKVTVEKFR